jgi:hypothetical protein
MMALGIGLAVNNGRAAIEGVFGRDVKFVRTPKSGATDSSRAIAAPCYRGRWAWHNTLELAFGFYCTATLAVALATQSWASVPFVTLFAGGFLYVGFTSLSEAWRAGASQGEASADAQAPSTHSSPSPQSMLS